MDGDRYFKVESCCTATLGELRQRNKDGRNPLDVFIDYVRGDGLSTHFKRFRVELEEFDASNKFFTADACSDTTESEIQTRFRTNVLEDDSLEDSRILAIVFHGTRPANIPIILEKGLDPSKRRGQVYGTGEYFSTDPSVCLSYCRGGKVILAFLVVVPSVTEQHAVHKRMMPCNWVVVEHSHHQYPLGAARFGAVDRRALAYSAAIRRQMNRARNKHIKETRHAKEASRKATIIQLLIKDMLDAAETKYKEYHTEMGDDSKREISMYVHKLFDEDVIPCLFPDLPPPMTNIEFNKRKSRTVETHIQDVKRAKTEWDRIRNEASKPRANISMSPIPTPSGSVPQTFDIMDAFSQGNMRFNGGGSSGRNGTWQTLDGAAVSHEMTRRKMIQEIINLVVGGTIRAPGWLIDTTRRAEQLEDMLYWNADSFADYTDSSTLENRVEQIMRCHDVQSVGDYI